MNEADTKAVLAKLAKRMGRSNASALLSVLGRDKQFVDAISSAAGVELMADAVACVEEKIALVMQNKETPEDRAVMTAYLTILKKWQEKIERYNKNNEVFEKGVV